MNRSDDGNNVMDFAKKHTEKRNAAMAVIGTELASKYLTIALYKIKLIMGDTIDIHREDVVRDICIAFDIANDEFLKNTELLDKYGEDQNTPSIQLLLINTIIDRAVQLFFGENFQADKVRNITDAFDSSYVMVLENDKSLAITLQPDIALDTIEGVIATLNSTEATLKHHIFYNTGDRQVNLSEVNDLNELHLIETRLTQSITTLKELLKSCRR